jgi:hypothetical protein
MFVTGQKQQYEQNEQGRREKPDMDHNNSNVLRKKNLLNKENNASNQPIQKKK